MSKPFAWSYSALDAFETCPKRYYITRIAKLVVEPQTQATVWGNQVHKALEQRLLTGNPLPETMSAFEPVAAQVAARARGGALKAESKMALTKSFQPTTWFGQGVWVRGITDFTIQKGDKVFIGDWKTGKPTPNSAQLKLTAAMTFAHQPKITTVINSFVWLKDGTSTVETFTREDVPKIWEEFMPRVQRMELAIAENKFPARPSGLCRKWCPVGKKHCDHCGE